MENLYRETRRLELEPIFEKIFVEQITIEKPFLSLKLQLYLQMEFIINELAELRANRIKYFAKENKFIEQERAERTQKIIICDSIFYNFA